jgi:NAD(P)-dependent dehydrogenase (short-subunit alcohol dehydrogenase family)
MLQRRMLKKLTRRIGSNGYRFLSYSSPFPLLILPSLTSPLPIYFPLCPPLPSLLCPLQIFGLDFRDISKLEAFCHFIELSYDRLDVLINNACQTVRRPPAYYSHLVEKEETYHAIATAETGTGALKSLPYQAPEAAAASSGEGEDMEEVLRAARGGGTGTAEATVATAVPMLLAKQNQFLSAYSSHQTALQVRDQQLIANSSASASSSGASSSATTASGASSSTSASTSASAIASVAVSHISSAQMSQLTFLPEEKSDHLNPSTLQLLFPLGYKDVNNQQIDLRHHNSWTMKLDEVSTVELAEVFAINSIAPTILNARLKPLMKRTKPIWLQAGIGISSEGLGRATGASAEGEGTREGWMMPWKFVVNVSAMEGKFYRYKSSNHPHTNMAKAALNMMTRTSAQDYRKDEIFMTAVDTGWINDEKPIERAMRHEEKHDFQTPLDEIDAASRVCDPVIGPLRAMEDWIQQQQQGKGKGVGERQELGKGERQQRKRGKGRDGIEGDATQVVPPKGMEPPWGHFIKDYMKSEW